MESPFMEKAPQIPMWIWFAAVAFASIINGFILMYAAGMLGIDERTYDRCFLCSFLTAITVLIIRFYISKGDILATSSLIAWPVSAIINTIFIKYILRTDWGRAFLTYILTIILGILIGVLLGCLCAGGLGCLGLSLMNH